MTKKTKTRTKRYRRKSHKIHGGKPELIPKEIQPCESNDSYETLLRKIGHNLNPTQSKEGSIGLLKSTPYDGCFDYLNAIVQELMKRDKIIKLNEAQREPLTKLIQQNTILELKEDYRSLVKSYPKDPALGFQILLGCIEALLEVLTNINQVIKLTGRDTFTEFTLYFNFKIERVQTQLVTLKGIAEKKALADNLVIANPLALYKVWSEHNKNNKSISNQELMKIEKGK